MIDVLRLDERLIHGQVAVGWVKGSNFDTLLVVDDESANDDFVKKTLYMAAPADLRTFVMTTSEALNVLTDERSRNRHIFTVVRHIDTLLEIAEKAIDVKEINIGNYGRLVMSDNQRYSYGGKLFLDDEEKAKLLSLKKLGIPTNFQLSPQAPKQGIESVFQKAEQGKGSGLSFHRRKI